MPAPRPRARAATRARVLVRSPRAWRLRRLQQRRRRRQAAPQSEQWPEQAEQSVWHEQAEQEPWGWPEPEESGWLAPAAAAPSRYFAPAPAAHSRWVVQVAEQSGWGAGAEHLRRHAPARASAAAAAALAAATEALAMARSALAAAEQAAAAASNRRPQMLTPVHSAAVERWAARPARSRASAHWRLADSLKQALERYERAAREAYDAYGDVPYARELNRRAQEAREAHRETKRAASAAGFAARNARVQRYKLDLHVMSVGEALRSLDGTVQARAGPWLCALRRRAAGPSPNTHKHTTTTTSSAANRHRRRPARPPSRRRWPSSPGACCWRS